MCEEFFWLSKLLLTRDTYSLLSRLKCIVWVYLVSFWEASMLGYGAGVGYMGPGPRMGPIDNFSLGTGPDNWLYIKQIDLKSVACIQTDCTEKQPT